MRLRREVPPCRCADDEADRWLHSPLSHVARVAIWATVDSSFRCWATGPLVRSGIMLFMDYDLSRLGESEFEHLTQALAIKVLGPAIQVFGDGPDGGREATFRGNVNYPYPAVDGPWNGYGLVQAKFRGRPTTSADTTWFLGQLRSELKQWANPNTSRRKMGNLPEYLLITTNVWLSAVPQSGGIDAANRLIEEFAEDLGLKGWDVWAGDKICRLLDNFPDVRRTFSAFVVPGDILGELMNLFPGSVVDLEDTLAIHARRELLATQWVRLNQAGSADSDKLTLAEIGIDLPGIDQHGAEAPGVISQIIERGDRVLRAGTTDDARHIVLVGGPGQGKTTLTQLLCQRYQTALLADRPASALGPAADVRAAVTARLDKLGIDPPRARRWPVRIQLSDFGDAVAGGIDLDLLRYLAQRLTDRAGVDIRPNQLRSWLRTWPWLIVLDGLDEVANPQVRNDVDEKITEFLTDAASVEADLLIVATTRPQGYNEEFSTAYYDHFTLRDFEPAEAIRYAEELVSLRHQNDPDQAREVLDRLTRAAEEPNTSRLMRTPLQVTIMSLLTERTARIPTSRYTLFAAYYDTIYAREVAKKGPDADLLAERKNDVDALHEHVGLLLQARSEHSGEAESILPRNELKGMAVQRLTDEGIPYGRAVALAQRLITAATRRLVLLAPIVQDHVGFDVRSLQEFMAAKALTTGPDSEVTTKLEGLAVGSHWRNTWLLAAGRVFADREHLRPELLTILQSIDLSSELTMIVAPGAGLALDLLDDDFAASTPKHERQLITRALDVLHKPPSDDGRRLAEALLPVFRRDPESVLIVKRELEAAIKSAGWPLLSSLDVLTKWASRPDRTTSFARALLHKATESVQQNSTEYVPDVGRKHGSSRTAQQGKPRSVNIVRFLTGELAKPVSDSARRELRERLAQEVDAFPPARREWAAKKALSSLVAVAVNAPGEDYISSGWAVAEELARISDELPLDRWCEARLLSGFASQWLALQPVDQNVLQLPKPCD